MRHDRSYSVAGKIAVLATMHGKERVIRPLIEGRLGLSMRLPRSLNTDRFGTFTGEVRRIGSQLDAARAKIAAAFEQEHEASVGIASEGSFGPHPLIPFVPLGHEIVVMRDRESGLELVGHHADLSTNFGHVTVADAAAAVAFAEHIGFPAHGLIVIGTTNGQPAVDRRLWKNIYTEPALIDAVNEAIALFGAAHVEADMRAHRSPTRMRAIEQATIDLVRQYRSECPVCGRPGFIVTERLPGLPCSSCGRPTHALRAEMSVCTACGHRAEKAAEAATADPGHCDDCNP